MMAFTDKFIKIRILLFLGILFFLKSTVHCTEFVVMNSEVSYSSSSDAFSRTIKDYSGYPSNWLTPDDYYHGTIYAYFKVIRVPTSVPFGMQVCFFQYYPSKAAFDGVNYNEVCSPVTTLQGINSEAYFSGTPDKWWKMGGRDVDFAKVYDFESIGPVIWGSNPAAPLIFTNGGGNDATWAQRANWLPCTIKVIIVAVSSGSTFSGWANYLGGTPQTPPAPTYTINYSAEKTNQNVPSSDEYSFSSGMSPVMAGTNTQLSLKPGQDIYFRTKANGSIPVSAIQHLVVPSRPSAPGFALDPETFLTTMPVTSEYEYSTTADMRDAISGNNTFISIPAGTTKYFRKKATGSEFKSIVQMLNATSPPGPGGIIAHWPVDNSGIDISGNNHHLTFLNGATYSTDHQQGAFSFSLNGVNNYASSDVINLGSEFTIMMWAKITSTLNSNTLIANAESGDITSGFKLFVNSYGLNDRRIVFESGNGSGLHYTNTADNAYELNTWNHVALVVNQTTGVAAIYYNGNNVTSYSGSHSPFNTNAVLRLGIMTNNQCAMAGFLDDVQVYSRILSQAEIQESMSTGLETPIHNLQEDEIQAVFPNPFCDELVVQNNSAKLIQILDMMGRVRVELVYPYNKPVRINTESLVPGIYIVRIIEADGTSQIIKVLKSETP
jgi:hypothetical protein